MMIIDTPIRPIRPVSPDTRGRPVRPDQRVRPSWPCPHRPPCPDAYAPDRDAARIRVGHPEQGWWLLCNGVVAFDDTGELLPDGHTIAPPGASGPTTA